MALPVYFSLAAVALGGATAPNHKGPLPKRFRDANVGVEWSQRDPRSGGGKGGRPSTGELRDVTTAATAHMNQFPDESKGYSVSNADVMPEFRGEYFEVTSDTITYSYGDVWWQHFPTIPIPDEVRRKLATDRLMISGVEANLMRRDEDGNEEIVPAYETYNHHVTVTFRGATASGQVPHFVETDGGHSKFQVENLDGPGWESVQYFLGAEMRGSFYYSPENYNVRVDHPRDITMEAMLINTGKPGGGRCTFPSDECPEPENSLAPAGSMWSGLLECPCTDRIERTIFGYVPASFADQCEIAVQDAEDCWDGAEEMGYTGTTWLLEDESYPPGCFVLADRDTVQVGYNKATKGASCNQMPEDMLLVGTVKLLDETSWSAEINLATGVGKNTFTGPADRWFGFGMGSTKMDGSIAFIVQADGSVHSRILGNHHPGSRFEGSIGEVLSNTVEDGVRTIVFTTIVPEARRMEMFTESDNLGGLTQQVPVIAALGYGPTLGYHWKKASGQLLLLGNNVPNCICRANPENPAGTIDGVVFSEDCADPLVAESNPTCNLLKYDGGIQCCRDGNVLLDSHQQQPQTSDQVYVKMRVYYEPEVTTGGTTVTYYAPEGLQREYHIPEGLIHGFSTHLLEVTKTAEEIFDFSHGDYVKLVFAQGHCHAPQCIRQEFWNADTNELLCSTDVTYGDNDEPMNEAGYIIGSSVCIFGDSDGLQTPPMINKSTRITTRKYADAEQRHHGDMAGWMLQYAPMWE